MKKEGLRNQFDDTTGLCDLLLRQLADPSCAHDDRNFGDAPLAENLGIAKREEIEDRNCVLFRPIYVLLASLGRYKSPELCEAN